MTRKLATIAFIAALSVGGYLFYRFIVKPSMTAAPPIAQTFSQQAIPQRPMLTAVGFQQPGTVAPKGQVNFRVSA